MKFPDTWEQLRIDMENCEQSRGQNMLQHGKAVWDYFWIINEVLSIGTDHSKAGNLLSRLKLPEWFTDYEEGLAWNRHPVSQVGYLYTHWHDCGKPYCRTVDKDGRIHFPNHAEISYQVWNHLNKKEPRNYYRPQYQEQIAELIRRDMEIHTIKAKDVEHFCRDRDTAVTLLLAGLAEIHANAEMFGGFDSSSFKIKYKQIDRRGRAICKFLKLEEEEEL